MTTVNISWLGAETVLHSLVGFEIACSFQMMRFGSFSEAAEFVSATGCFWLDLRRVILLQRAATRTFWQTFLKNPVGFGKN